MEHNKRRRKQLRWWMRWRHGHSCLIEFTYFFLTNVRNVFRLSVSHDAPVLLWALVLTVKDASTREGSSTPTRITGSNHVFRFTDSPLISKAHFDAVVFYNYTLMADGTCSKTSFLLLGTNTPFVFLNTLVHVLENINESPTEEGRLRAADGSALGLIWWRQYRE